MFFSTPPLVRGAFGIMEPASRIETCYDHALLVAPARALSKKGERIGRGKGYYDRYIRENRNRIVTIGVCFSFQLYETLPVGVMDERLEHIISGGL